MGFLDTVPKLIIAGIIVLSALGIVAYTIRMILRRGGKVAIKGVELSEGELKLPCIDYVKAHSEMLSSIGNTLGKMETQRQEARAENSEANKHIQTLIKHILTCQDAMLEAYQKNQLGNGNLEKARKSLATCYDIRDNYLIDQL